MDEVADLSGDGRGWGGWVEVGRHLTENTVKCTHVCVCASRKHLTEMLCIDPGAVCAGRSACCGSCAM